MSFVYAARNDEENRPELPQKYNHIELPVVIKTGFTTSNIPRWNPEMGDRNPPRKGLTSSTQIGQWNRFFYIGCNSVSDMKKIENFINGAKGGGPFSKETCWAGRSKVLIDQSRELVYTQWSVLKELFRDIVDSPEKYGLSEDACLWFVDEYGRRDDGVSEDYDSDTDTEVRTPRVQQRTHRRRNKPKMTRKEKQGLYKNILGENNSIYKFFVDNWDDKKHWRYFDAFKEATDNDHVVFCVDREPSFGRNNILKRVKLNLNDIESIKIWIDELKYINKLTKGLYYYKTGRKSAITDATLGNGNLLALLRTKVLHDYYGISYR